MNNDERFTHAGVVNPSGGMPPPPDALKVIAFDLARQIVRDMIKTHFEDDSCAASAAFVEGTLAALGVRTEAVPVHVICFNRELMAWGAKAGKLIPDSQEELERAHKMGGRMVIMAGRPERAADVKTLAGALSYVAMPADQEPDEGRFPGHVVVMATSGMGSTLIDLSIDQVQNTTSGMKPQPVALNVVGRFEEPGDVLLVENNGAIIMYERIDDQSFRTSPDYRLTIEDDPVFNTITDRLSDAVFNLVKSIYESIQDNSAVRSLPSSAVAREIILDEDNPLFRLNYKTTEDEDNEQ